MLAPSYEASRAWTQKVDYLERHSHNVVGLKNHHVSLLDFYGFDK